MPAVIVENDESEWKDETGEIYHFPKRYLPILPPGQKVIYYKSRLRNPAYATERFSAEPHYFGIAEMAYNSIHWSGTTSTSGDPSDPNSWLKNAALHPNMAPDFDCNMGHIQPGGTYHYHALPTGLYERLGGSYPWNVPPGTPYTVTDVAPFGLDGPGMAFLFTGLFATTHRPPLTAPIGTNRHRDGL